jgi:hypothetical protein
MTFDETDELPDREKASEFYAKYELKEVLGMYVLQIWIFNECVFD